MTWPLIIIALALLAYLISLWLVRREKSKDDIAY
jgi:FtsZ-interacting cell division protein ZipA